MSSTCDRLTLLSYILFTIIHEDSTSENVGIYSYKDFFQDISLDNKT